ncbi:heavy metal translocating P-type ATPase [Kushneria phosphatilytica]|uniref:P-type Zn(2+) transporter n=1 Tax=Kushneria phosphatilytica TaxID=657387 RepID=A0A5C0ZWX4_9GAMM|nr:heavy metal translocating P-type ATPase [Kushneria phosphatilytica]QEL10354.1 heavy metal translocating P-type ATPase [Kushneria phosphatilytica]
MSDETSLQRAQYFQPVAPDAEASASGPVVRADRGSAAGGCRHGHHEHDQTHEHAGCDHDHEHTCCGHDHGHDHDHGGCGHDHGSTEQAAELSGLHGSVAEGDKWRTSMRIMQMDCPVEEQMIRKKLDGMTSVERMDFNLVQRVLTVVHAPDALEEVLAAIRSLGFTPELPDASGELGEKPAQQTSWWPLAASGVAALASEAVHWFQGPVWLSALLAVAAIAGCGLTTFRKGWTAVRNGNLNINALMSIAVTGALAIGQWPEAAMVMVLFNIAELIEARSLDRARNAIEGLVELSPATATVQQPDGQWQTMAIEEIAIGSRIRVRPGERIGLDGHIVAGQSSINQAPITGESLPVEKSVGDTVYAGTINEVGELEFRTTAAASDTTLARIIHTVEEAQSAQAPTQRFIDRFSRIYTPAVVVLAALVAVLPPLIAGGAWLDWIYRALVLLVIACPCALVISTPVTVVTGLANAARRGILIKGGVHLEQGRTLKWLALDKTGTLTYGRPVQTDFEALNGEPSWLQAQATALAARSDHPVSMAIATAGREAQCDEVTVEQFEALPGRGVKGRIEGQMLWLGNHQLVHELDVCSPEIERRLEALERQGRSVVLMMSEHRALALFAVADTVKETSREAIDELHRLGIRTLMLTGDNQHTAESIGKSVGIDSVRGELMPEHKLQAIEELTLQGRVGMIGDGINDAPALTRADIGFAMGAMGTDTAIETADVALMDDDLRKVPMFIRLSRATRSILIQNIVLALGIKAVFLALTLFGWGTLWMAVFADVGASVLVVLNGLRMLRA